MKDQVHIRNAEAAHLARTLARQTGRTINDVVLEALKQYRPNQHGRRSQDRIDRWLHLLREDRAQGFVTPEFPIETLYDETTGLPK